MVNIEKEENKNNKKYNTEAGITQTQITLGLVTSTFASNLKDSYSKEFLSKP